MNNQSRPKFSVALQTDAMKNLINNTLGDPAKSQRFVSSITSAVATNPALQDCDHKTIISAALLGEALNLSPSPQLGQYYLVPYKNNKIGITEAQFQLGYKGYIQLAIRSGQYKKLNAIDVKEGELKEYDPFTDIYTFEPIKDPVERKKAKTIGYYAFLQYHNGFEKGIFMFKEEMEEHALKYSSGYRAKKGFTFWEKDFDVMAHKTMLRQLISHWGVMSIEMADAFRKDMSVMHEDGTIEYVDNEVEVLETEEVKTIEDKPEKTTKKKSLDDI